MSDISALSSLLTSLPTVSSTSTSSSTDSLGMSDFFTLLAAQMQYQDPLEPTDNSEFMGQMAQFAQLEQTKSLVSNSNYLIGAFMLGANVMYSQTTTYGNSSVSSSVEGVVKAVDLSGDSPQLYVNDTWVPLSNITRVGLADSSDSTSTTTSSTDTSSTSST